MNSVHDLDPLRLGRMIDGRSSQFGRLGHRLLRYSTREGFPETHQFYPASLLTTLSLTCVAKPVPPPFEVLNEGENPPLDAYDNFVIGPK